MWDLSSEDELVIAHNGGSWSHRILEWWKSLQTEFQIENFNFQHYTTVKGRVQCGINFKCWWLMSQTNGLSSNLVMYKLEISLYIEHRWICCWYFERLVSTEINLSFTVMSVSREIFCCPYKSNSPIAWVQNLTLCRHQLQFECILKSKPVFWCWNNSFTVTGIF